MLKFTGNWFIDAGILGFVNLMEEVYGGVWKEEWKEKNPTEPEWKFDFLEYLKNKLKEEEGNEKDGKKLIYYRYFPFAYLFYNSKLRYIFDEIKKVKKEIFGDGNKKGLVNKKEEEEQKLNDINKKLEKLNERGKNYKKVKKKQEKIMQKIEELEKEIGSKNKKIKELKRKVKSEKKKLYNMFFRNNKNDTKKEGDKIKEFFPDFKLKGSATGRNFALFNSKLTKDVIGSLRYIRYLIDLDKAIRNDNEKEYEEIFKEFTKFIKNKIKKREKEGLTYEIIPDSTINPFLYSEQKFPNIGYTHQHSIRQLIQQLKPYIPIYITFLTFEYGFLPISGKNILFYTNNLNICYFINKNLKIKLEKARNKNKKSIFYLTWQAILDELIKRKASFSLENLYLVELNLEQNKLSFVEYLSIPKLQARVLLDDHIRDALNQRVLILKAGKNVTYKWVLEEFISGKPLYPSALQHIKTSLTDDKPKVNYFIFYALLLDAAILEFKEKQEKLLFSDNFLYQNYKEIIRQVKTEFSLAFYYITQDIPQNIGSLDERKRIAYLLLGALYGNDKARFLWILLKQLNDNKKNINLSSLNWIFHKVINNNTSWKEYALLLIGGMVYKNE